MISLPLRLLKAPLLNSVERREQIRFMLMMSVTLHIVGLPHRIWKMDEQEKKNAKVKKKMPFVTPSEEKNLNFPEEIESPGGRTELIQQLPDYLNQLELLEAHRHLIPMGTRSLWQGESDEEDETDSEENLKIKEKELENDPANLLLWASEKNQIPILRRLLSEHPTLVNVRDEDQYTPLHRAAYSGHLEAARELISHEADVNARTIDGWTPLHSACNWSNTEVASFLLQHGADINAQTNGNQTSLHLASGNKATKATIELLLMNRYMNPNLRNNLGETPYDVAWRTNSYYYLFEITENCTNSVLDS